MYLQTVKMSRSVCYRGSKWHFISLSHDAYLCIGKLFKGFLSTCRNKTLHSLLLCLHFVESLLKTCTVRCDQYWLRYRTNCALQLQEPPADWTKQSRLWRDCRRDRALIFPLLSCWFHSATNQHDIIFKLDFLLSRPTFIFPPLQAAKGGGGEVEILLALKPWLGTESCDAVHFMSRIWILTEALIFHSLCRQMLGHCLKRSPSRFIAIRSRNIGNRLQDCTVPEPRKPWSASSPPWEPQV
jgi:hypothetical protein